MRVLLINGSAHTHGCTYTALSEVARILHESDIQTEILQIGSKPVQECIACGKCEHKYPCALNDALMNEWVEKVKEADGYIFGTPVYYAHPTGAIQAVLDRLFFSRGKLLAHKPGAAIAVARRAGTSGSLDVLNKYFSINQMPIVGSTYWNMVHGMTPDEIHQDLEGMQTMRNLGRNMAWLLKCIDAGKAAGITPPSAEREHSTNFIR